MSEFPVKFPVKTPDILPLPVIVGDVNVLLVNVSSEVLLINKSFAETKCVCVRARELVWAYVYTCVY